MGHFGPAPLPNLLLRLGYLTSPGPTMKSLAFLLFGWRLFPARPMKRSRPVLKRRWLFRRDRLRRAPHVVGMMVAIGPLDHLR